MTIDKNKRYTDISQGLLTDRVGSLSVHFEWLFISVVGMLWWCVVAREGSWKNVRRRKIRLPGGLLKTIRHGRPGRAPSGPMLMRGDIFAASHGGGAGC